MTAQLCLTGNGSRDGSVFLLSVRVQRHAEFPWQLQKLWSVALMRYELAKTCFLEKIGTQYETLHATI